MTDDRNRAEEIAANALTLTDLESIGALSLRKLIDAIATFASEVRAEQREADAEKCRSVASDHGGQYTDSGDVAMECAIAILSER